VAIVSGRVGAGKSKLIYDFSADHKNLEGRRSYFLLPGALISSESLREIRASRNIVIIEDASRVVSSLGEVLFHAQRVGAKVILADTPVNALSLRERLLEAGAIADSIVDIRIGRQGRDDTIALARQVLGREEPLIENAIVMHASESPLSTILAARVMRDRGQVAQTQAEARDLMGALFSDVLAGEVDTGIPREDAKAVLQLVAATSPARLEDDKWLEGAMQFLGWQDRERLLRVLDAIEDSGAFAQLGGLYYVPELIRQQILREAGVVRGRATDFPIRLYEAFGVNREVLLNVASVDGEITADGGPGIFKPLWQQIADDARASDSLQRAVILDALTGVAHFKPRDVLGLVEYLIDNPATNDAEQPTAEALGILGHEIVLRQTPAILQAVMSADPRYVPAVVRRLWVIGKDQERQIGSSDPLEVVKGFTTYGFGFDEKRGLLIVRTVAGMISDGERDTEKHSLIDLITPLLSRDAHTFVSQGSNVGLRTFVVDVLRLQTIRDEAIAVLAAAALGNDDLRADRAIKVLVGLLREPENQVAEPEAQTVAAWNRERGLALDALDEIVIAKAWPLRELRIATQLRWFSKHSPSDFVRSRTCATLDRIESGSDEDRYRTLIPEFLRPEFFADLQKSADFQTAWRAQKDLISRTVDEWFAGSSDAAAFLEDLATRAEAAARAGLSATSRYVFAALASAHPEAANNVLNEILEKGNGRFPDAGPLISSVFEADIDEAERLAERLLREGDPQLAISLAEGLNPNLGADAAAVKARLLGMLLTHENLSVRRAAARALMFFCSRSEGYAIDLILATDLEADAKLADDTYMALGSIDLADDSRLEKLAEKLRPIPRLGYWPIYQLGRIAEINPRAVFELFAWRVQNGPNDHNYQPIPYVDHEVESVLQTVSCSDWFQDKGLQQIHEMRGHAAPGRQYYIEHFVASIGRVAPEIVKSEVERGLSSDDLTDQKAAVRLLAATSHPTIECDIDFIVRTADRAAHLSPDIASYYQSALISSLTSGAELLVAYEASPSDQRVQHVACLALERVKEPATQRLFEELRDWGQHSERRSIQRSEEHLGPQ
jgi:hypothetical protein